MMYRYESEDGRSLSRDYPIGKAPRRISHKGLAFTRQLGCNFTVAGARGGSRGRAGHKGDITEWQAKPYDPEVLKAGGSWDDNGIAHFPTKGAVKEWARRTETEHGGYVWSN